jgi:hypothetical protein
MKEHAYVETNATQQAVLPVKWVTIPSTNDLFPGVYTSGCLEPPAPRPHLPVQKLGHDRHVRVIVQGDDVVGCKAKHSHVEHVTIVQPDVLQGCRGCWHERAPSTRDGDTFTFNLARTNPLLVKFGVQNPFILLASKIII